MAKRSKGRRAKSSPRSRAGASGNQASAVSLPLSRAHAASLDALIAAVREAGGPRFSRSEVMEALIEAAEGRTFEAARVRSTADLRVAFGGIDLSRVEKLLRDRPRIESGLLKALEETIK